MRARKIGPIDGMDERYEVRMDADLKAWTIANGGSDLVRRLLEQERNRLATEEMTRPPGAIIGGRRYVVCQHPVYDVDGTRLHTFCGALIDVTEYGSLVPPDISCGGSHVSTWNERGG